ncbi:response regulator [Sphingomonas flavalba]|uniref:response regulator n=1 Tax=Sphingomonas flavalba TaxID=2559804 RepID=UPI00109DFFEB|nr:response regulator [Sphingomonas flavalba]
MLFDRKARMIERVLIVEDEPLVAFDSEHFLIEQGYQVVATVDSVAQALAVIAAEQIDLVLADVSLSDDGDGVAVAQAAHARGIATLFVTGACPPDARQFAIGCLAKPYGHRQLRQVIDTVQAVMRGETPEQLPAGLSLY